MKILALIGLLALTGCDKKHSVGLKALGVSNDYSPLINGDFGGWTNHVQIFTHAYGVVDSNAVGWKVNIDGLMTTQLSRVAENGIAAAKLDVLFVDPSNGTETCRYVIIEQFYPTSGSGGSVHITARVKTSSPGVQLMPGFFPGGF